jgi:hypothetical protein
MEKIKKQIKIKYICDKCYFSSENEDDFVKIGNFNLCLKCFRNFEEYLENFKGQKITKTIENFIFEEQ